MLRTKSSKAQKFPAIPESTSLRTSCFTLITRLPGGQESGPLESGDPQFRCSDGAAVAGRLPYVVINGTIKTATKASNRTYLISASPFFQLLLSSNNQ